MSDATTIEAPRGATTRVAAPVRPAIEAHQLGAAYGRRSVWSNASFAIAPGEFVAVLGANGTGKSTLLRMVLGLMRPHAGRLTVLGAPPRRGNPRIGYVPQRRMLDPHLALRARELVALGLDGHRWGIPRPWGRGPARKLVDTLIEAVEATPFADRAAGELSGGQLQRLLLAQALVGDPQLLLLDEPLANLDVRNQVAVAELVARLSRERGMAVLLVAHDVNPLLPLVDRVLYMGRGEVAIGTAEEVVNAAVLTRLYDTPVEVLTDSRGRVFVVGLEHEATHPHAHGEDDD
jgi:zinc/manganese transport system ATP-binding protein